MQPAQTFGRRGVAAAAPPALAPRMAPPQASPAKAAPARSAPAKAASVVQPAATRSTAPSEFSIILRLLFGFQGRLQRSSYRLYRIVGYAAAVGGVWAFANALRVNAHNLSAEMLVFAAGLLGLLVWWWNTLALQVKRWHDLDKSGAWCLLGFIPAVGQLLVLIQLMGSEGTPGPNRFGPSPRIASTPTVFET